MVRTDPLRNNFANRKATREGSISDLEQPEIIRTDNESNISREPNRLRQSLGT